MSTEDIRVNTLERTMELIFTTATAAEKLKRLAKTLRKTTKTSLAAALDAVAKQHGYEHWKHVTICIEHTAGNNQALPEFLKEYLDQAATRDPASSTTQLAFRQGCVFALDIKDALEFPTTSEFVQCDDGWYLAARDIWPVWVHDRDEETNTTLIETLHNEDLAANLIEDQQNYSFLRYAGATAPVSLEQAYERIMQHSFFAPFYVWLNGKFIDLGEVPEIRVNGHVMFSTTRT